MRNLVLVVGVVLAVAIGANRAGREAAVALHRLLHPEAALPRSA